MPRIAHAAPVTNRLLDRLTVRDRTHVISKCENVELALGEVLTEPGAPIRDVYFPLGSFISMLKPMDGKHILEVAIEIGRASCRERVSKQV